MKSIVLSHRFGSLLLASAMLAACGGGANGLDGSSVTPSMRAVAARGKARIRIRIPHRLQLVPLPIPLSKQRAHVRPRYVSPSTQSMTVVVAGGAVPTQTYNLTPASSSCSTSAGELTCSETAFFPPGQQTITIALYDQQNGSGHQLSTASEEVTIATGAVTNVSVTLNGVPSTAKVLLNGSASLNIPQGTPTSIPASVTAYDADNNIIMTPGSYSAPVTLSDSDGSGATMLSTTSVTAPGANITLSYNGANVSTATITPGINGTAQPGGVATLTFASQGPAITLYQISPVTGATPVPSGITAGPDGAIWFSEAYSNKIGRATTAGTIAAEYSIPLPASINGPIPSVKPAGITVGPDAALWFAESSPWMGNAIGSVTTTGTFTQYLLPGATGTGADGTSQPSELATGPDGALWFTWVLGGANNNLVGRMTTTGTVTTYTLPTQNAQPIGIAAGADHALWVTENIGNSVARITTNGTITEYSIPTSNGNSFVRYGNPNGITTGPDGALWFVEQYGNKIGRITTAGAITEYSIPTNASNPIDIAAGEDGALWFTELSGDKIGQITTGGTITEYSVPTVTGFGPYRITPAPSGAHALWFTVRGNGTATGNQIGVITLASSPATRVLRHR